jgi:hypothetical protein
MPETLGFVEASVEAHRLLKGFLLCSIETGATRSEVDERRERTQLRVADWQDIDIVGGLWLIWYRNGEHEISLV